MVIAGKQASLAADFSIPQFAHICRLLLVHGRYCYKRSCALSQFVMHRGKLMSVIADCFYSMFSTFSKLNFRPNLSKNQISYLIDWNDVNSVSCEQRMIFGLHWNKLLNNKKLIWGHWVVRNVQILMLFVISGLIISIMQAIFSCVFYFASVSLYQGVLMVA